MVIRERGQDRWYLFLDQYQEWPQGYFAMETHRSSTRAAGTTRPPPGGDPAVRRRSTARSFPCVATSGRGCARTHRPRTKELRASSRLQAVPDAWLGDEVPRVRGVGLELAAQLCHVDAQVVRLGVRCGPRISCRSSLRPTILPRLRVRISSMCHSVGVSRTVAPVASSTRRRARSTVNGRGPDHRLAASAWGRGAPRRGCGRAARQCRTAWSRSRRPRRRGRRPCRRWSAGRRAPRSAGSTSCGSRAARRCRRGPAARGRAPRRRDASR